jgi:hypothetical protein
MRAVQRESNCKRIVDVVAANGVDPGANECNGYEQMGKGEPASFGDL